MAEIGIATNKLAFIVLKARAYDAQVPPVDPDDASNAADDRFVDALEGDRDNLVGRELRTAIADLDADAQAALVALAWIGREDFEPEEWDEAHAAARERRESHTWRYLMGLPMLGDLIEEGAAKLGVSLGPDETEAMSDPAAPPSPVD